MKKILLSLVVIASAFAANSQVTCIGISPASIAGNYTFEWADPGGADWATPDFLIANTFIEDTLVLVNDGTAGTNPNVGNGSGIAAGGLFGNNSSKGNSNCNGRSPFAFVNSPAQ